MWKFMSEMWRAMTLHVTWLIYDAPWLYVWHECGNSWVGDIWLIYISTYYLFMTRHDIWRAMILCVTWLIWNAPWLYMGHDSIYIYHPLWLINISPAYQAAHCDIWLMYISPTISPALHNMTRHDSTCDMDVGRDSDVTRHDSMCDMNVWHDSHVTRHDSTFDITRIWRAMTLCVTWMCDMTHVWRAMTLHLAWLVYDAPWRWLY